MSEPKTPAMRESDCRSCGARIAWAYTLAGKAMPLDAASRRNAVVVENGDATGRVYVAVRTCFTSHFETCPNSAQHRKPKGRHA